MVIAYPLVDLLRKISGVGAYVYLVYDLFFLCFLAYFIRVTKISIVSVAIALIIAIFLCHLISLTLFTESNFILNVVGIRTYFYLTVGLFFLVSKTPKTFFRSDVVAHTLFSVATIVYLQVAFKFVGVDFLPSLEHSFRSFGRDEIGLFSGPFSSSKKCGRFLVLLSAIYFLRFDKSIFLLIVAGGAIILTGSRESILMYMLLLVYLNGFRLKFYAMSIAATVPLVVFFAVQDNLILNYALSTFSIENLVTRISQAYPPGLFTFNSADKLFGFGPGSYGQETKFVAGSRDYIATYLSSARIDVLVGSESYADSGLVKFVVEVGLVGLVFIFLLLSLCVFMGIRHRHYLPLVCLAMFCVLALKAHPIMNDVGLMVLLYLSKVELYERKEIRHSAL